MAFNRLVVAIIPGPHAPKSWDTYMERTLRKFADMGSDEGALEVKDLVMQVDDEGNNMYIEVERKHKAFLGAFYADLPGRGKAMCRGSTAAWIGCSW